MGKIEWSILHDLGYVYYVLGTLGSESIKERLPLIWKKYSEWPFEGADNEKIFQEVLQTFSEYIENSTGDSIDLVLERLGSSVINLRDNYSQKSLGDVINDLFDIVNSVSPTDWQIEKLNQTAELFGVETVKMDKQKKDPGKINNAGGETWTLLHDMCYLYYVIANFSILGLSSNDKSKNKDNMTRR